MPFAALDLHKAEIEAALVDDAGRLTRRLRFPATRQAITAFAHQHLSPEHRVAIEATFNTWAVVDLIQPFVHSVTVGNPLLTRAIAQAKIKTDKIDARVLAHLLRLGYLPEVWIPDEATRQLRLQTTERSCLTADRTRLKNRIHGILNQRLIQAPAELFSPAGLDWLRALPLDAVGRRALDRLLGQLELVVHDLAESSAALAPLAYADPRVRLLMTLPGVGFVVAQVLVAALGDLTRFPSPDRAASYLGLVPSTYQSGNKTYTRHVHCGRPAVRDVLPEPQPDFALRYGRKSPLIRRNAAHSQQEGVGVKLLELADEPRWVRGRRSDAGWSGSSGSAHASTSRVPGQGSRREAEAEEGVARHHDMRAGRVRQVRRQRGYNMPP
jgi:transposase